ncbi:MAG TPA: methylmalonyl-CoA epimerase [Planctomycetes bacterium]|nr:methylmalonyl-CoA epimerase [Planctomycetota bacterium]
MNPLGNLEIDHIGIAVEKLSEAQRFWCDALGARIIGEEEIPSQKVRVVFLDTGDGCTELIEATDESSPIARFIERRGAGLHHVALRVDDIDAHLHHLRESGHRLIDEAAVTGRRGTRVAFIHPRSAGGVLIELVELIAESEGEGR